MLLIITNQTDLACDYLILRLKERGIPFRRFNTEEYGRTISVDISFDEDKLDYAIRFESDYELGPKSISAVYFRQPSPQSLTKQSTKLRELSRRRNY